ncbi:MAG: NUDIX hydrolase [Lachnospiraceae bacterium]|nr:NUDIX hydrolase [Lachnospiraceae bacterium]
MEKLERISRELIHKGAVIDFYQDKVKDENGLVKTYDSIIHKGAAAVVAVKDDGKILMVKQYRNILDRFTIELPAGGKDTTDEPSVVCAARELEEETGYITDDLELLLSIRTTVAFCNEAIDIYIARNLKTSKQNLDEGEFIDVYEYDIEELIQMIYECKIQDSKTVCALLAYYNKFVKNN